MLRTQIRANQDQAQCVLALRTQRPNVVDLTQVEHEQSTYSHPATLHLMPALPSIALFVCSQVLGARSIESTSLSANRARRLIWAYRDRSARLESHTSRECNVTRNSQSGSRARRSLRGCRIPRAGGRPAR